MGDLTMIVCPFINERTKTSEKYQRLSVYILRGHANTLQDHLAMSSTFFNTGNFVVKLQFYIVHGYIISANVFLWQYENAFYAKRQEFLWITVFNIQYDFLTYPVFPDDMVSLTVWQ